MIIITPALGVELLNKNSIAFQKRRPENETRSGFDFVWFFFFNSKVEITILIPSNSNLIEISRIQIGRHFSF